MLVELIISPRSVGRSLRSIHWAIDHIGKVDKNRRNIQHFLVFVGKIVEKNRRIQHLQRNSQTRKKIDRIDQKWDETETMELSWIDHRGENRQNGKKSTQSEFVSFELYALKCNFALCVFFCKILGNFKNVTANY